MRNILAAIPWESALCKLANLAPFLGLCTFVHVSFSGFGITILAYLIRKKRIYMCSSQVVQGLYKLTFEHSAILVTASPEESAIIICESKCNSFALSHSPPLIKYLQPICLLKLNSRSHFPANHKVLTLSKFPWTLFLYGSDWGEKSVTIRGFKSVKIGLADITLL